MTQRKIVWMPEQSCPEEWWGRFTAAKDEESKILLLCEAHEKKWITIFGQTDKDVRDIASVLQEFFKVLVIDKKSIRGNDDDN